MKKSELRQLIKEELRRVIVESTKNLDATLKKLIKKGVMKSGDAEYIVDNVWNVEPRNVKEMDEFLNGDNIGADPTFPAAEIFKAYAKDVKASTRRPNG